MTPGDSSAFSGAVPAIAVAIQFDSATTSWSTPGIATILVDRAGNTSGTVSVGFATADGTAVAGVDYASTSGSLAFAPGVTTRSIIVPLLDARIAVGDFAFTITLSTPAFGATLGTPATTTVIIDVDNQGGQYHIYIVDTNSGAVTNDATNRGSLPWAIAQSNANPSSSPALLNEIVFAIPGTGLQTISPIAVLPTITEPVEIDGYSQPGSQTNTTATGDTATILVRIDGSQLAGSGINGLTINANDCTVDGLIITGFSGAGISLETPSTLFPLAAIGTHIWGNFIGVAQFSAAQDIIVDPSRNPDANQAGIIVASSNNDLGGSLPVGRNLIQGNKEAGVILYGSGATGNLVEGNFILDNGGDGVLVLSSSNEIGQPIGAGTAGAGDVISGNHANGVFILGPSAQGNIVANDLIGTRPDGTGPRPNVGDGVLIENAPGNVVGGTGTNDRDVIAANGGEGVMIENDQGSALPASYVPTQVSQALTDAGYSVERTPYQRHGQPRAGQLDRLRSHRRPLPDAEYRWSVPLVIGEPSRRQHGRRSERHHRQPPRRGRRLGLPARRHQQRHRHDPQRPADSERDRGQLHRHPGRRRRLRQRPRRRLALRRDQQHDRRIVERRHERHLRE